MRKSINIIIWAVALIALLAAAYTFYSKNTGGGVNSPDRQSTRNTIAAQTGTGQSDQSGTVQPSTNQSTDSGKGNTMAPDFALKDLDGKSVKLSDYRGKIVILNFWAVWCKYCKQEMPDLNELNTELQKKEDAVILAVDVQDPVNSIRDYLKSDNISIRVLLDQDGAVMQKYGISGFPTTFVINTDGSVYTYNVGATDKESLLQILDKMKTGESAK